jgi:hypothetical protein
MFNRKEQKDLELTPELAALEGQLAELKVAPLHVDRDRLMFEAGRAAGRKERDLAATLRLAGAPRWFWPTAAATMAAACLILAAMLVWRDDAALVAQHETKPHVGQRALRRTTIKQVPVLADSIQFPQSTVRPGGGYLEKRYLALTRGVAELQWESDSADSLQSAGSKRPATARELLRELAPSRVAAAPNS